MSTEKLLQCCAPCRFYPGVETDANRHLWWFFDYLCDAVYLLDLLFFKTRVQFVRNGITEVTLTFNFLLMSDDLNIDALILLQRNRKECLKNYVKGDIFRVNTQKMTA